LVELLVVIGIVAVLISILLPVVSGARNHSKLVKCLSNLQQLANGVQLYGAENRGRLPPNVTSPAPGQIWYDEARVGKYFRNSLSAAGPIGGVFVCPSDDEGSRSYSMNVWASGRVDSSVTNGAVAGWKAGRPKPEMILFADSWSCFRPIPALGWVAPATIGFRGQTAGQRFGAAGGLVPYDAARWGMVNCELPYMRHRAWGAGRGKEPKGRVVFAYVDGHAAVKTDRELANAATGVSTFDTLWSPFDRELN
jgi:prepilin-type processing-associated H-X9-DG protein